MNGLFGDNILFLYIFACTTIMNYSRMSETQKMILFYLLTFGLAILKVISVKESLLFLLLVSFFYLEFLTEDSEKIKFITKLRYKLIDFIFLMIFQYYLFFLSVSFIFASTTVQKIFQGFKIFPFGSGGLLAQILSILLFFLTIYNMSQEKFKIKSFHSLIANEFVPPINESNLLPYQEFFYILVSMEDKTYFSRKNGFNALAFDLILSKIRNFWDTIKESGFSVAFEKYGNVPQIIRGYSTIEMQLLRTVALESGYNKIFTRKIFELLYTNIIFKSMQNYYDKNNYVNSEQFKTYLLSIYINNVRTKINGTIYSNMIKYLGEETENWTKEKFYIACLGLPYQTFTEYYVLEVHQDIIANFSLNTDVIKREITSIGVTRKSYYGSEEQENDTILTF